MKRSYAFLIPAVVLSGAALALTHMGCVTLDPVSGTFEWHGFERKTAFPPDESSVHAQSTPQELLERYAGEVDGRFRLPPDARFLDAFRELERIVVGSDPGRPTARLERGRWILESQGRRIPGELAEFPTFAAWLDALDAWARELQTGRAAIAQGELAPSSELASRLATWDADTILEELASIDTRWRAGERRAADLAGATRAFAELTLIAADDFQLLDRLPARALAALALARQIDRERMVRDEILIAIALDHSRHAADLAAAKLPATDPFAAFALSDTDALASASRVANTRESRALLGLALVLQGLHQEWRQWLASVPREEVYSALWVRLAYAAGGLEVLDGMTRVALYQANRRFAPEGFDPEDGSDAALVRRTREVRKGILKASAEFAGPWVDPALYQNLQRSLWLCGLYRRGRFYTDMLGSVGHADAFAQELARVDDEDTRVFQRWYAPLTDSRAAIADRAELQRQLREPSLLGPLQRKRTMERLIRQDVADQHLDAGLIADLAAHYDARPALLLEAGYLARLHFQDIALAERLEAPALAVDAPHRSWSVVNAAERDGDEAALWRMTESRNADVRAEALRALGDLPASDAARLESAYARELKRRPDAADLTSSYARFLAEQRKNLAGAAALIRSYLERNDDGTLLAADMHRMQSWYHRESGDVQAAWRAIEPALESYKANVLSEGVYVLIELGRMAQAEELARGRLERYPGPGSAVTLARVLWAQERDDEAAKALRAAEAGSAASDRRGRFNQGFGEAFENAPPERALAAFTAMVDAGVEFDVLIDCVLTMRERGKGPLSFELSQRIRQPSHAFHIYMVGFPGLLEQQGREQATRWMVEHMGASELHLAGSFFFKFKQDHLLWDTFELAGAKPDAKIWRWRAASAARGAALTPTQRTALEAYYAPAAKSLDDQVGRFLAGVVREQELLDQVRTPAELCQVAYALALRSFGQGRYAPGARWLQIAIATRAGQTSEYVLALDHRQELTRRKQSLARLEREHEAQTEVAEVKAAK